MSPIVIVGPKNIVGSSSAQLGTPVGGSGLFASWQAAPGRLEVVIDPYAMQPLFWSTKGEVIAVSPSITALLRAGVDGTLDLESIATFHLLGYYIGETTPFSSVRAVTCPFIFDRGQLRFEADTLSAAADPVRTEAAAVDRYAALFSRAVRRAAACVEAPILLPLSGGRDSRHIAFELHRHGIRFEAVTFNTAGRSGHDPDARVAAQVARALNIGHREIGGVSKWRDQIAAIRISELLADEHFQYMPLIRLLEQHQHAIFDGLAGDVLSRNGSFSQPELNRLIRAGQIKAAVDELVGFRNSYDRTSFHDRTSAMPELRSYEERARQRIAEEVSRFRDAPDPYAHFTFANRTRREIALLSGMMLPAAQCFVPYLDVELAAFCQSLPESLTSDGRFHDRVITRSYPEQELPYAAASDVKWTRRTAAQKIRMGLEALREARRISVLEALREPRRQLRILTNARESAVYFWRAYAAALSVAQRTSVHDAALDAAA
jgi:hypothetical protein